jgi:hypothetical protein
VKETIAEFISSKIRYGCLQSWWDMLKFALQFRAKAYFKQQAFRRKMTILTLEKDLLNINDLVALQPSDNELQLRRAQLDQTLADYYEDIQEAARMKAGMKYKSQGERPTKYFTTLVKQRSEKKNLTALTVKRNGSEVSLHTMEEILEEASDFYADLYSRKVQIDDSDSARVFLNKKISNCLSDEDRVTCDKALTEDELFAALKKLPSGKMPGIDGLPAELFREICQKS